MIARDLLGHVRASIIYMDKMDSDFLVYARTESPDGYDYTRTPQKYREILEDCESDMNRAMRELKVSKSTSEAAIILGTVMDRLKQIVAVENIVSEEISYIGNPLHTQSLEEDTLSRYMRVE